MQLISETSDKKQRILLIDRSSSRLSKLLREDFEKYDSEIYISPHLTRNVESFDYVFFINPTLPFKKVETKLVLIFIGKKYNSDDLRAFAKKNSQYRIIQLAHDISIKQDLERILWFSFTKSTENFLRIETLGEVKRKVRQPLFSWNFKNYLTRKSIFVTVLLFVFVYNFLLFSLIGTSLMLFFSSASALVKNNISRSETLLNYGSFSFGLANNLYFPLRPTYHFLSIALITDSLFDISQRGRNVIKNSLTAYENANEMNRLIFKKDKNEGERQTLLVRINKLRYDVKNLKEDLVEINQKIPKSLLKYSKFNLAENIDLLQKADSLIAHLEEILGKDGQKKYLLLFTNNMELRPGGGFIGSFGQITVSDLTVKKIEIYDVYDADGQLKKHVDPPAAIKQHLNQPNWFLRDSAFSPDFFENYTQAKFFLNTELQMKDFAGGILLTTTAIQNIIEAFSNLYIPDYEENVNKDNFYIKAQLYSEKDFFPGSTQKKNFLGSVAKQILINIEDVSSVQLFKMLKKSLDEKQMVIYFDSQKIQSQFDSLYWSGKMISPRCVDGSNDCLLDYIFPVDANLGVNKANFFVTRNASLKVRIDNEGRIKNEFTLMIKNESPNDVFPGGKYKNYFQLFLPAASVVEQIVKNNVLVESYDQSQGDYKTIGFLTEIQPKKSLEIKITYGLLDKVKKEGKSTYQLLFQKQIGSKNSDLKLEFILPNNLSVVNQNFTPLVKDNIVSYNTSLTADKIFLIELQGK